MEPRILLARLSGLFFALLFLSTLNAYAQEAGDLLVTDWEYKPNTFINSVYVDDLNGDGVNELIATTKDGVIYDLLKKKSGHTNWQYILKGDVKALKILDYDGDGKKEILAGTDNMGLSVRLLDWQGGIKGSSIEYDPSVYSLDASDIDGDGKNDIIIGAQAKSVDIFSTSKDKILWSYATNGPVYYVKGTDLNGDGKPVVVAASIWNDNEQDYAEVYAIDSKGKNKWTYGVSGGIIGSASHPVDVFDVNGDGKAEVLVGSKTHGLDVLSPGGALLWNYQTEKYVNVVYAYKDAGRTVILLGATPYVYALDGGGAIIWRYRVNTTVYALEAADINSDVKPEVLVGAGNYLHVLSEAGKELSSLNYAGDVHGLATGDLNGDGGTEVVAGLGWSEARLDHNYQFGNIVVYTVNKDYTATGTNPEKPLQTTTTTQTRVTNPGKKTTTSTLTEADTVLTTETIETSTTESIEPAKTNNGVTLAILAGLGIGGLILLIILAVIVVLVLKKKSGGKKPPAEPKPANTT